MSGRTVTELPFDGVDSAGHRFVWRWVVTFINRNGYRRLWHGNYPEYTWDGKLKVDAEIERIKEQNTRERFDQLFGDQCWDSLEPRKCRCNPQNNKPTQRWFKP